MPSLRRQSSAKRATKCRQPVPTRSILQSSATDAFLRRRRVRYTTQLTFLGDLFQPLLTASTQTYTNSRFLRLPNGTSLVRAEPLIAPLSNRYKEHRVDAEPQEPNTRGTSFGANPQNGPDT